MHSIFGVLHRKRASKFMCSVPFQLENVQNHAIVPLQVDLKSNPAHPFSLFLNPQF